MSDEEKTVYQNMIDNLDTRQTDENGNAIKDSLGNYITKSDDEIKESIQEELNFYQGFYQNILLGLPINVDFNKLNLIKQKQALLTGSLKTIINVPEIPDVYRNDMLKFIINRLENATLVNKNKDSMKIKH